jgi:hypothetical protein
MKFIDHYFEQTRPPVAELTRFYFHGLFRPESVAGEDSFASWLIQLLAVLIAASWYFPVQLFRRYMELHALPSPDPYRAAYSSDCLFALVLMMLLVSMVTVIEWPALFPSRRDHLVLTPLPITRGQMFSAKLAALLLFIGIFIAAITLLSCIAIPSIASGNWELRPLSLRIGALLIAALGVCAFAFFSLLATQGLLLLLLPVRWFEATSFGLQVSLLLLFLCAFPLLPYLPAHFLVTSRPAWIAALPACWFWGLAEWLAGARDPLIQLLAKRAVTSGCIAFALVATAYLSSYLTYGRMLLESPARRRSTALWTIGTPQTRAIAEFIVQTITRVRQHKLIFFLIFGIGVALVIESSVYLALHRQTLHHFGTELEQAVIAVPLTLSFFAMVALRCVFRMAADLPANWLFQITSDPATRRRQLDAVFNTFVFLAALPILFASSPLEFWVLGQLAFVALILQVILALALSEYLLTGWRAIPFTFTQNPIRRHFVLSAVMHLAELTLYSFLSAAWIDSGLHDAWKLAEFSGIAIVALFWLRRRRLRDWAQTPIEFSEAATSSVEPLNLLGAEI